MIKLLLHSWLFSSPSLAGVSQQQSGLSQMLQFLKKKYRELKMKFRTLKLFQRRRSARRRNKTDRWVRYIVILCFLTLMILPLLANCSYRMVPHETKVEYGTVDTDSKNDKLQQKKSVTQTWRWKRHD